MGGLLLSLATSLERDLSLKVHIASRQGNRLRKQQSQHHDVIIYFFSWVDCRLSSQNIELFKGLDGGARRDAIGQNSKGAYFGAK